MQTPPLRRASEAPLPDPVRPPIPPELPGTPDPPDIPLSPIPPQPLPVPELPGFGRPWRNLTP